MLDFQSPRLLRVVLGALALVAFAFVVFLRGNAPPALGSKTRILGSSANRGSNGLWLEYTWYFGERSPAEYPALVERLRQNGIRSAYFHVRFIKRDGTLRFHFPGPAKELNTRIEALAPEVTRYAYVFVGTKDGGGSVDLSNQAARRRMIPEAKWLVRVCGFSGIHWDYEACHDGDPSFLTLLDETRKALPGIPISVASPIWLPHIKHFGWSEAYYASVAKRCDELAVMCYDTGYTVPKHYTSLIHQNMAHVCAAVLETNPMCRVLIGVPTYKDGSTSAKGCAENLTAALEAVRTGPKAANLGGVALFADYTTSPGEWQTYADLWPQVREATEMAQTRGDSSILAEIQPSP